MVEGFEILTYELNEYETEKLLPLLIEGFKTKLGKEKEITSTEIIRVLTAKGYKITGARLRKIVNYIRVNNLIFNLISTSKGYYIATSQEECLKYLKSLKERIGSITSVYDALEFQLKETIKK